jgi:hypothetical protein
MLKPVPLAQLAHATAGRTRLRFPARAGDTDFFTACAARLSELPGVLAVQPRALTASLLIEHEGAFEAVAKRAQEAGVFLVTEDEPEPPTLTIPPAAGLLGALALLQLLRSHILPPAITLAWYAASLLKEQEPQPRKASTRSVRSQGRSRSRRPT